VPCLVLLLSATATTSFAAAWAARLSGRRAAVQVVMHGNLNDIVGWRPRNPLARAFDTLAALRARYPVPLRFVVLEEAIRAALGRMVPGTESRTDVLPLPMNAVEAAEAPPRAPAPPLSIGFVGLGTTEKGMDRFVALARRLRARHGARLRFVHVGRMPEDADPTAADVLADPPSSAHLPRAEFVRRMAALDFVVLPYRRGYYDLSASGALIDAVTWLKPVIATRVPLTEQFFAEYGDLGVLCDDDDALEAAVKEVLLRPDAARHARWVAALERARAARAPDALATRYRCMVEQNFPGLLGQEAA
jgi:glycosyltransferase involved in cell wall biosynthesis